MNGVQWEWWMCRWALGSGSYCQGEYLTHHIYSTGGVCGIETRQTSRSWLSVFNQPQLAQIDDRPTGVLTPASTDNVMIPYKYNTQARYWEVNPQWLSSIPSAVIGLYIHVYTHTNDKYMIIHWPQNLLGFNLGILDYDGHVSGDIKQVTRGGGLKSRHHIPPSRLETDFQHISQGLQHKTHSICNIIDWCMDTVHP